jgi:hypothetical protein
MAIQIQGYQQRVDLGQGVNTPGIQPSVTRTGLGEAIEEGASRADRALANYERAQVENAETESLSAAAKTRLELEQAFRDDQLKAEPGAANFTPTFLKKMDSAVTTGAERLSSDEARKRYRERMDSFRVDMGSRVIGWEAGERVTKRTLDFQTAADDNANSVYTVDGASRDLTYRNLYKDIDSSLDAIGLPPGVREQLREESKNKMASAAVKGDLRDRPDRVQDWLVKGNGSGYFSLLRNAESGGRNIGSDTSSAFGPYQFTAGTWRNVVKSHPELGLTEADRFRPAAQETAIRAFTADNVAYLKKAGIEPTNTNVYMAHFLGAGGAVEFIRAFKNNPDAAASQHVAPASVAANRGVFRAGRTVGDVMAMFGKKFGNDVGYDKGGDVPSYYADIPFAKRDALYGEAESEMNKRRVSGEAGFRQRVENSIAEFATNGMASSPPSEQEFMAAFGANRGGVAYGEYVAKSQGAAAMYQMRNMTAQEMHGFVESQRPKINDPFFAERQDAFGKMGQIRDSATEALLRREDDRATREAVEGQAAVAGRRAMDKQKLEKQKELYEAQAKAHADMAKVRDDMLKLRMDDFAGYTTMVDPRARDALKAAMNGDQEAARQYSASLYTNSARLNAPVTRFLPKQQGEELANNLNRSITTTQDASATVAQFRQAKAVWGNDWDRVLGDMKDHLSATARVVASDINTRAATTLVTVHDKTFEDLTKSLGKGSSRDITEELVSNFREFAMSAAYMPGDDAPTFFAQSQKLAAVYQQQGMTSTEAAQAAYKDMVGSRYSFEGVTRIPAKETGIGMLLQDEKEAVIQNKLIDTATLPPGVSEDDLAAHVRGNAQWVTLPNDKGVALMVGGSMFRDNNGRALVRSWQDLRDNGTARRTEMQSRSVFERNIGDLSGAMR